MWLPYTRVSINVPDLESNEIYISHVGDGEYDFNTFGSAHLNLMKLFENLAKELKCKTIDLKIESYFNPNTGLINENDYFIVYNGQDQMRITIEIIDPESFLFGG